MPDESLLKILDNCMMMEGQAIKMYSRMVQISNGELQEFWMNMVQQEKEHAQYWKCLIQLAQESKIRNMFDFPLRIINELDDAIQKIEKFSNELSNDVESMFIIAYRLEFTLLHPAFQALFIAMKTVTGDQNPANQYHDHIAGLIKAYRRFASDHPSFELIADLSEKLLRRNEQIADQLMEINVLRGLLPICMHCKNIRKEDGGWIKVEAYIEEHSEAEFSHGICPDCMKKYYSEYFTDEEIET